MKKRALILTTLLLALLLGACQGLAPNVPTPAPASEPSAEQRAAAATAQAISNLIQYKAADLETALDEGLKGKYTGMTIDPYTPEVTVFHKGASQAELDAFLTDPELRPYVKLAAAEVSREELRAEREALKTRLAELGEEITTAILMDPIRLEVYAHDTAKVKKLLKDNAIVVPEYVTFVAAETLPEAG